MSNAVTTPMGTMTEDGLATLRRAFEDGAPLSPAENLALRHANGRALGMLKSIVAEGQAAIAAEGK